MIKKIEAIIREEKLQDVKDALRDLGIVGMNVFEIRGHGRQGGIELTGRTGTYHVDMLPKMQLNIILSEHNVEKTIATNYLGMFKLTHNLLPMLHQKPPSRIINISSGMHKTGKIDFEDFMFEKRYKSMEAYATSKLIVTAYTYALAERLNGTGITANVVEPGFVATNLGANMGGFWDKLAFTIVRPMQVSAERGAETSIWAVSEPELEDVSGKTFAKKTEVKSAEVTYDKDFQGRLWEKTAKLLGL